MGGFSLFPPAYGGSWHSSSFSHMVLYNFRLPWWGTGARGRGPKWQAGPWKWGHGVPELKGQKAGAFSLRDSEGNSLLEWVSQGVGRKAKRGRQGLSQVALWGVLGRLHRGSVRVESNWARLWRWPHLTSAPLISSSQGTRNWIATVSGSVWYSWHWSMNCRAHRVLTG